MRDNISELIRKAHEVRIIAYATNEKVDTESPTTSNLRPSVGGGCNSWLLSPTSAIDRDHIVLPWCGKLELNLILSVEKAELGTDPAIRFSIDNDARSAMAYYVSDVRTAQSNGRLLQYRNYNYLLK